MIKTLLNPNHVLTDCDNITDIDGQRMASVLGKHIYGYKPGEPDMSVVKVLGLDENDDVRWSAAQSPGGTPYTGGNGIDIRNHVVSIDTDVVQEKMKPGQNVTISQDNVISATGTTYSAGSNIQISQDNVISATDSHRPIQVNGAQLLGNNAMPLNLKAGGNVTLSTSAVGDVRTVTISAAGSEQADWIESDTTSKSYIQNKPTLRYKAPDAGAYTNLTGLTVDQTDTVTDMNLSISGIAFQNNSIPSGYLVPGLWKDFLNSASTNYGDSNHHAFIVHDSNGRLYFRRGKRMFWEFGYINPTITLTAQDVSRDYAEFPLALTSEGLQIMSNNDMITIKGYNIQTGNILNGKKLSLYLKPHGSPDDSGWLMCDGMETYTENTANGYAWKAFKGWGLTDANNGGAVDAYLRVPLSGSGVEGATLTIDGRITITIVGVAGNDA